VEKVQEKELKKKIEGLREKKNKGDSGSGESYGAGEGTALTPKNPKREGGEGLKIGVVD